MPIQSNPIPGFDPNGALIGYQNLLTQSTTELAQVALIPNTFERFIPPAGALSVKFQLGSIAECDFIGIAAHTIKGETLLISTAATIGGATTAVASISPTNDRPILITFDAKLIEEVIISGTLIAETEIGIVYAGKLLRMERALYGGHSPINLSQKTEYQNTVSDSGQFLGRNIIRKGLSTSFAWQFLSPSWYRETFQPFVVSATEFPFFINWRPDRFSNEVAFGFTTTDITPTNMGGGSGLLSVSMNMRAQSDL